MLSYPTTTSSSATLVGTPASATNFKGLSISTKPINSSGNNINFNCKYASSVIKKSTYATRSTSTDRNQDARPLKRRKASGAPQLTPDSAMPGHSSTLAAAAAAAARTQQLPLTPTTPTYPLAMLQAQGDVGNPPLTPISPIDLVHHMQPFPTAMHPHHAPPRHMTRRPSAAAAAAASAAATAAAARNAPPALTIASVTEMARHQYVPQQPSTGLHLVTEHRGLAPHGSVLPPLLHDVMGSVPTNPPTSNLQTVPLTDAAVIVWPTSGLDNLFATENRYHFDDAFLTCRTNMSGGVQVNLARRVAISWMISVNSSHNLFRYKVNTLCVAVQYMDRYLATMVRPVDASSQHHSTSSSPSSSPSAPRPAALSQWRTYDWHLLAIVCLSLAAKMVEEYDDPAMESLKNLDFDPAHVRIIQMAVAKALNFSLGAASPINFVHELLAQPVIRALVAELLPLVPAAVQEQQQEERLRRRQQQQQQQQAFMEQHQPLGDGPSVPMTPPKSPEMVVEDFEVDSQYEDSDISYSPARALVGDQAPVPALEQWAGMLVPDLVEPALMIAEQYLLSILAAQESAQFRPSELAVASLNLALEVRSLQLNAVSRVDPVTGIRRAQFASKSVALGFYGHAMTARANICREFLLQLLPRERFFQLQPVAAPVAPTPAQHTAAMAHPVAPALV
ncbi:hypothetical protein BC828DRAFT_404863 [Blastocladiella britannica]|nr:hypothetical protein BC828DRAFT_404863 [Blastocladiella britannica]